jgi:hypothetical protein
VGAPRPPRRWAVAIYDRCYRFWYELDDPRAGVGPALRVEIRRRRRPLHLRDGTVVLPGDRVGVLHLDNERIAALHVDGPTPMATGLAFRRHLLVSLRKLADLARPPGWLSAVRAFSATTIFHRGLHRLGFEIEPGALAWPGLTAAYQRALLASLHPAGASRARRAAFARGERLWISRGRLLALYGEPGESPP